MHDSKIPGHRKKKWLNWQLIRRTYHRTNINTPKRKKFMETFYKKILITGGLGFIGSHVAEVFAHHLHEVTIIDNLQHNVVPHDFWEDENGFITVCPISIDEFLQNNPPSFDIVCHLAAPVGPVGILEHAGDMAKTIINHTVDLRDYCINAGALFVNISTSEVYGHTGQLKEDSEKIFPGTYQVRTEYGASKMAAEIAIVNKAKVDDRLKYHIIRPFNVAGARQQPDGGVVLPRFILQAVKGEPLTVYGDGEQRRGFTDVRDVAEGIYRITMNKKNLTNEIWNIGNPDNTKTINELAALVVGEVCTRKKKWRIKPVDPVDLHGTLFSEVPEKVPYIGKLTRELRWRPFIPILQVVKSAVAYWRGKVSED